MRRCHAVSRRGALRGGFTLVEVLLTTVLAAVLLSVLWNLLSMHMKLFSTGQTKTEQSQLARTLLQQMSDDVHSIVQPPPVQPPIPVAVGLPMIAPPPAASSSSSSPSSSSSSGSNSNSAKSNGAAPAQPITAPPPTQPTVKLPAQSATTLPQQPGATAGATASAPPPPAKSSGAANSPIASAAAALSANLNRGRSSVPGGQADNTVVATMSLRPAGLVGSETHLQIDIRKATIPKPDELLETRSRTAKAVSRVDELRTVAYAFEDRRDPRHPLSESQMALVRREVDWEQAHPATHGGGRAAGRAPRPAVSIPATLGANASPDSQFIDTETDEQSSELGQGQPDEMVEVAPEVVDFGLRYFDGAQWVTEWDSAARKGLPLAIEVAMQLRSFDEPDHKAQAVVETSSDDLLLKKPKLPVYRLLIHLPGSSPPNNAARSDSTGNDSMRGPMRAPSAAGAKRPLEGDLHGPRP